MFDGLKNKLNRFTEDVEDDAETTEVPEGEEPPAGEDEQPPRAEGEPPVDGDHPPAQGEQPQTGEGRQPPPAQDGADGAPPQPPEADQSPAQSPESAQSPAQSPESDQPPAQPTGDEQSPAQPPEDEQPPADQPAGAAEEPTGESDEEGRGLAERAKLLATGKTVIDEDDLDTHLEDLEFALLRSDVEMEVAEEILEGVRENLVGETRRRLSSTGNLVRDALREALYDVISVGQFDFEAFVAEADKPVVMVFTGVNGVGKTTTIAKLSRYLETQGFSTVLANGDTYRAGANEQLQEHADALGKKVISHEQGSDPAAVLYDAVEYAEANDVDVVLGDTAGRLHTDDGLMDQLAKIDRVVDPDLTLFVDEAVAGQDAVNRAQEFDEAAGTDATILTKADADPQGGAAISIAHVTGRPILFLGTGQDYDDLERFDPERIVDELIGA